MTPTSTEVEYSHTGINARFEERCDKYQEYQIFPQELHLRRGDRHGS
ncbi:hypothetical protein [Allocoleopsis franciscana]|uniref:Uncharacterized protein n=1 Tax=Allocoleopsis franciscana PCC 7113 TaxID=1173027 RepID=K9WDA2_9CYAN|nr:hypothetical protein [Allocoleopsis franciscana]AFZ17781.1 hypothetical protein Mic7113_1928 [Allocoleopsis franciscana PCC 7113]